ncbi:MAG: hypothetical protein QOC92_4020 [Acidimicrobiaceae bacterium]
MVLSADAFVEAAITTTGLDDFGEGLWRDGLDVFCDALNQEANLSDVGVAVHESRISHLLSQRLRVVDWHARHPDISAEEIRRPVIVMGLPRTGTTALAHLLAADPDSRSLRTWEETEPTPPPEAVTATDDPRIAATQAGIDMSHQLMPVLPQLYFATAVSPSEALDLTGMSFRAFQFEGQAHVPSYEEWLLACDMTDAYRFQRQVQQLLQWHCPPTRWAWKNPPDVFCLPAVRAAFPDATFIWTHRDPFAALSSVCSLVAVVRSFGTDDFDRADLGPRQTELWAEGVDRGMAARETFGTDAFIDVWMHDLARDAIGTVGHIYDRLGWPLTARAEDAMRAWLDENPRHGRGGHEPKPEEFGLDEAAVRERFAEYRRRFGREERDG